MKNDTDTLDSLSSLTTTILDALKPAKKQEIESQHLTTKAIGSTKIPSLDGFRGIAISFVLLNHVFLTNYLHKNMLLTIFSGGFGVQIFFVISGFLVTSLTIKEQVEKGKMQVRKFYIRRGLRILPVAYLYLCAVLILNQVFRLNVTPFSWTSAFFYFKNIFYQISTGGDWQTAHFWSLSVEEQFYLFFPLLFAIPSKHQIPTIIFILLIYPLTLYAEVHNFLPHTIGINILIDISRNLTPILIGSLMAIMIFRKIVKPPKEIKHLGTVSIALMILAGVVQSNLLVIIPSTFSTTLSSLSIAVVLFLNISPSENFLFRSLNNKYVAYLGVLSYSIYIWQQLFTHDVPWRNLFPFAGSPLFNLPLLLLVAYLSYTFYEKKFLTLKARFH